jgi:hypothetical protein
MDVNGGGLLFDGGISFLSDASSGTRSVRGTTAVYNEAWILCTPAR